MAEFEARLPCPVCLGVRMHKVRLGKPGRQLTLDHCPRCGGLWFDHGEIAAVRRRPESVLSGKLGDVTTPGTGRCHQCHAHVERTAEKCPACGIRLHIDCPACQTQLTQVRYGDHTIEICPDCKGAWFDADEVATIWNTEVAETVHRTEITKHDGDDIDEASLLLIHAMAWSPDLAFFGASAANAAAETLSNAPQAIAGAGDVVAEVAGNVFETIVDIIGGIFS